MVTRALVAAAAVVWAGAPSRSRSLPSCARRRWPGAEIPCAHCRACAWRRWSGRAPPSPRSRRQRWSWRSSPRPAVALGPRTAAVVRAVAAGGELTRARVRRRRQPGAKLPHAAVPTTVLTTAAGVFDEMPKRGEGGKATECQLQGQHISLCTISNTNMNST
jgi:hypothetical protein